MEKFSWRCMRIVKWKKNVLKRKFSIYSNTQKNYNNNVNPIFNKNIKHFSDTHIYSDIDPNSRHVIEKYKNLIKEANKNQEGVEKPQKKESIFPQNLVNKYKNQNINNEQNNSLYSQDKSIKHDKNSNKTNDIDKIKDNNNNVIPNKDEKYIILKKQITKEFIHKVFLPHVESQIIYHIKTYTPDQIVNIFHIYSYLYYFDKKKEIVDQLLEYLKYRLDCFSVNNIVLVMEPLYILNKINNIYIYRLIINYINKISDKFNLYNYIGISRVFTKILIDLYAQENTTTNTKIVLTNLLKYIKQSKYRKELPLNQKNISHKDFIIQFMNQIIDRIDNQLHLLSAIELTDMLTVISNYSFKNDYSKYYIPKELARNNSGTIETQNDDGKSSTIFNESQTHTLTQNNAYFFKENVMYFIIIKEMIKKYDNLTTLHKITNLYSLSKLCIYDEEFIQLIEKDINNYHYINNIHHKYLALLVWCLFKFKILNRHIDNLKPIIQQNIFNFNAKGLSRLCHSISSEKEVLHKIANNLINNVPNMSINEFLCYFYSVVYLDLLPFYDFPGGKNYEQGIKKKTHSNDHRSKVNANRDLGDKNKTGTNNMINELQLLKKNDILQKCIGFINDNKKDLGKDEMTKIVLLLKKKNQGKYLYVLDMLPEEWKGILHFIN
ncbi:conserved Plasmodium protein, unknown function [Plasmodium berghei]|uniref:Uncharacterized protein n=2 Tax=Plasmodium berghei TaxID=5821 RepID=A0A509AE13_PLABA|nr:conserved protein, unknown function [Plasmodium berghei ANKA]SCL90033.1 conserved Plasmodium protein, unknown function [Plasmodium berghei]SCM15203.1 conserved Plasmodium protein, unknown function [Plasmodium berghei]SCM16998.1 conserved Plasmodium protein, unknown function [Plasmodium berghei]SCN21839.1 conserved Plasmodium protein, unknown function [Plasmodium berghei]VUC53927.1 conserved protein, unknown function [Plasmodium berghei ANKA]|eukprot:XP_034419779.1 conserved protein, unknown function [Plasmodium berghei ANKA]